MENNAKGEESSRDLFPYHKSEEGVLKSKVYHDTDPHLYLFPSFLHLLNLIFISLILFLFIFIIFRSSILPIFDSHLSYSSRSTWFLSSSDHLLMLIVFLRLFFIIFLSSIFIFIINFIIDPHLHYLLIFIFIILWSSSLSSSYPSYLLVTLTYIFN